MHFVAPAADIVASWLIGEVPALHTATSSGAKRSRAEQVSDVFNLHDVVCQMGRATSVSGAEHGTLIPCFYHPTRGTIATSELRVFAQSAGERAYAQYFRNLACKVAGPGGGSKVLTYLHGRDWIMTGPATAYSAGQVGQSLTDFSCP
jgi:hypothetical protein